MYVDLPVEGCNILNSSTSLYNYSVDGRTRTQYALYDGNLYKVAESYNQYGYTYTGTCLSTGDLVYKPEIKIYFEFIAGTVVGIIFYLLFQLIIKKIRWRA